MSTQITQYKLEQCCRFEVRALKNLNISWSNAVDFEVGATQKNGLILTAKICESCLI